MAHILDFEREIYEIENQIDALTSLSIKIDSVGDITHDVSKLKKKLRHVKKDVFAGLNGWQTTQVARHPDRPYTLDYINYMLTDFIELHGDRRGGHGPSIVSGLAKFEGQSVMVIGHQKGRDTEEKIRRNFGMSQPGGYRKALRLMLLAEKFNIPIITLIDTPGAYPGIEAEEFGQSEAIATNMYEMSKLRVPIITTVIGEGGSGGALAIGMGNVVLMLEHSVYSVISPEGCASILWGDRGKVKQAADALGLTADVLFKNKVVDQIVPEPLGGAHRNHKRAANLLKKSLRPILKNLLAMSPDQLTAQRQEKFRKIGEFSSQTD